VPTLRSRPALLVVRRLAVPMLVLAALALAVAGCGGDGSSDAADLVGTYTTTLGPSGPELKEPNPPGRWQLLLTSPTEAYFQPPEGTSFPVGNPVVTEDGRITFAPDSGCPTQTGAAGDGTYTWSLDGDTLSFTEVDDTCRDRVFVLTSQPWTRAEEG
jgi:hypothetical protein